MALQPGIILAGQTPDIIGTLARSTQAASQRNDLTRQNALADLYRTQGAGIAAGDPGAVNALAGMDPYAAMQVQDTITQRGYAANQEGRAQSAAARAAAEWAQSQDAATVAAETARTESALSGAAYFHQNGDRAGYDNFLRQNGADPAEYPFEQFPAIAAQFGEVLDVWKGFAPAPAPGPLSGPGKIQADIAAGILPPDTPLTGPGTSVTVNNGGTDKQIFDTLKESADAARAAETGLRALGEAQTALSSQGGVITGAGADLRLNAAKLGALLGVTDPTIISNTETFRSAIAPQVAAVMKATVGSAQISNADREFAEKAAGGSIALDRSSIDRLLGIMEKAAMIAIDRHNAKLDAVYPDGQGFDRERALFGIQGAAQQSATDQPADDLTPEERQYLGLQ